MTWKRFILFVVLGGVASALLGQALPTVSISSTTVADSGEKIVVKENLISSLKLSDGIYIVRIKGKLPYDITPKETTAIPLADAEGNTAIVVSVGDKEVTVKVSYQVIHPTDKEKLEARNKFLKDVPGDKVDWEAYDKFLENLSKDDVFQDSLTLNAKPTPPGPTPGPDPPPDPNPTPAPIPVEGFRVLFFIDDKDNLTPGQVSILYGAEVDEYLNKTCVTEKDGQAGWRVYDKDADLANELDVWKTAHQRRPEKTPWVIISNGKTGTEEPLPETVQEFLDLCKKYEVK